MTLSRRQEALARTAAALVGSYIFCWGFVSLGVVLLVAAGVEFEEALMAVKLTVFLVFVGLFFWSFLGRNLVAIWAVLLLGGAAAISVSSYLQSTMVGV